jgi:hypothetical protein
MSYRCKRLHLKKQGVGVPIFCIRIDTFSIGNTPGSQLKQKA